MVASDDLGVVVIGAGITGLTTAIAVGRLGIPVLVVERDTAPRESGTALSLWPNALAALGRSDCHRPSVRSEVRSPAGSSASGQGGRS